MRFRAVRTLAVSAGILGLSLGFGAFTSAASARPMGGTAGGDTLVPAHPGQLLPARGGTVDSLNWSGYAVTPGSGVTAVSSSFTVPTAGLIPPGFAATWTGIGGYNTSDLIQAGTGEDSAPTNPLFGPQYFAWYELLPASETPISNCTGDVNCTVTPGDKVTVNISQVSGSTWNISMADAGHWTWAQNVQYASSGSSAEWILEAPTVGAQTTIAPVGTVNFGPTSTYTVGGVTKTIAQGDPTQIVLSPGVINEATPSALASDGQSFNDCAYAQTCAAP
jgi:hypothetical protein